MMNLDHAWNSLVTMTLQSVVVCLMAGIGLLLLRRAAAATRHLVLLLAMSALLAVPFLALFLPHWQVPLVTQPSAPVAPVAPAIQRTLVPSSDPAAPTGSTGSLPLPKASTPTTYASVSVPTLPSQLPEPASARPQRNPSPTLSAVAGEVRNAHVGEPHQARIPLWQTARCRQTVVAIWLLGAALALLRLLAGLIGTWRVTSRETIADPLLSQTVARIQAELGRERALTVRQTIAEAACLPVPLTWGLFRPTVLLPPTFLEWSSERQRMVVLHELAHIQRADWLVQVLVQITLALYWFHPLVWWSTHRLQAESERACDDTVLMTGVAPSAYAETLLEVVRTMNRSRRSAVTTPSMLSMAQPPIEARLQAILSPQRRQRPPRPAMLSASAGTALCAILLATVQVQAVQTPILLTADRSTPVVPVTGAFNRPFASALPARPSTAASVSDPSAPRSASPQMGTERTATHAQERQDERDIAMLHKKLDTLELLLVHAQEENAGLRQQIKEIEAANEEAARLHQTRSEFHGPLERPQSNPTSDPN